MKNDLLSKSSAKEYHYPYNMGMAGFATALTVITTIISPCIYGKEFSDHPEVKVQRLLKQLNKPALKSIKVIYTHNFFLICFGVVLSNNK